MGNSRSPNLRDVSESERIHHVLKFFRPTYPVYLASRVAGEFGLSEKETKKLLDFLVDHEFLASAEVNGLQIYSESMATLVHFAEEADKKIKELRANANQARQG